MPVAAAATTNSTRIRAAVVLATESVNRPSAAQASTGAAALIAVTQPRWACRNGSTRMSPSNSGPAGAAVAKT
jgi:hypothetical protein